jgi:hypothetical protein
VDLDGRIYMVDQFFRKVEVFRPAQLPASAAYGRQPAASATAQRQVSAASAPR